MKKSLFASALLALSVALLIGISDAGEKSKYTNKEIMAKAMKGGLCNKVASGKATDAEKAQLVELFTAMHQNTAKKGDAASWKAKTDALLAAAKSGDGAALKAAANCKACHDEHK